MDNLNPAQWLKHCRHFVGARFVGPESTVNNLCTALLSGLHVLVEDLPGTGKTTLARAFAQATGLDLGRIQCTPDLLPGDILGMLVFDRASQDFRFKPGAIMHSMVFADELNRCPTRTQAAFLEAMQETQISVEGTSLRLPEPFFLLATQNPAGFAGTFPLPEAQLDRFGMKLRLGYPDPTREARILDMNLESPTTPADSKSISMDDPLSAIPQSPADGLAGLVLAFRTLAIQVRVHPAVRDFTVALLQKSRNHRHLRSGLAPRAGVHLLKASQARALLENRDFVVPDDLVSLAVPLLAHRVLLSAEARIAGLDAEEVIRQLVDEVPKPLPVV